jgi:hypothetical protein
MTRERIFTVFGLAILGFELINAEVLGKSFHYEFLIAGLALCGIGVAQIGDRK